MNMRIVIICSLYPPYIKGGAEISTSLLAKSLSEKGHEVHVITQGEHNETVTNDNITIHRLKSRNVYWEYRSCDRGGFKKLLWHVIDIYNQFLTKQLSRLLKSIHPDVVHTNNIAGISCAAWGVAHKLNLPIVHTLRDYYLMCPKSTMMRNHESCEKQCNTCHVFSLIKKHMSQKVDAVVGISEYILKRHIAAGYFKKSIMRVIPNCVSVQEQSYTDDCGKAIGYIGRISPEKGIEFLIEAFKKSQNKRAKLLIAGTGKLDYVEMLKAKYEAENVIFMGRCNPSDFFSRINLLVVPSLWNEPFGRVVIESYSYHIPVFMAKNGGLAELKEKGVSYAFSTDNSSQLIELLNDFFRNRIHVENDVFDKVLQKYSCDKIVNSYTDLYSCIQKNL